MAGSNETPKVNLYSYNKAWNVEKKIYSIMNMILPVPINPYMVLMFFAVLLFVMVVERIIPVLMFVPSIIKYLAFPFIGATYLMKKKLDGKNPLLYLVWIIYHVLFERGKYLERFKSHADREDKLILDWNCSRGKCKEGERDNEVPD